MTICIFCGKEISEKEYPIPVAKIHFQPVLAGGRGAGDDILQGKESCQDCHKKIMANNAKAVSEDAQSYIVEK